MIKNNIPKKIVEFLFILIILTIICIGPEIQNQNIFKYSVKNIDTSETANELLDSASKRINYVSLKDTTIRQKIFVKGSYSDLSVYFYIPNAIDNYSNAKINFKLSQNNIERTCSVQANLLQTSGFFDIPINLSDFDEGKINISISSSGLSQSSDVFCVYSEDNISELTDAISNNEDLGAPIFLRYKIIIHDKYYYYDAIMLILTICLIVVISVYLTFFKEKVITNNVLFICAAALSFVCISLENPFVSVYGEPKSEAVYNLWYSVKNKSFLENMMTDLNNLSLIWPSRLLMELTNIISPGKFFFRFAQTSEVIIASILTSFPCLKRFNNKFPPICCLLLALLFSNGLFFNQYYLLFGFSYLGVFWFIFLFTTNLKDLRLWQYIFAVVVSVIFCVSRMQYILLIPIGIYLIITNCKRYKRFILINVINFIACVFNIAYSFAVNNSNIHIQNAHISLKDIVINTIYYQVQLINSYIYRIDFAKSPYMKNIVGLSIFIVIVLIYLLIIIFDRKKYKIIMALGSFGILSLGTICINVYTSAGHTVAFGHDFSSKINWGETFFQQADFHFSFVYVALTGIWITLFIYAVGKVSETNIAYKNICYNILITLMMAVTVFVYLRAPHNRLNMDEVEVDWKNSYKVTLNNSYYISVNDIYPAAPISMAQNTSAVLIGNDGAGSFYNYQFGISPEYDHNIPYSQCNIGEFDNITDRKIYTITVKRAINSFNMPLTLIAYDREGNCIDKIEQSSSNERLWVDFYPDEPLCNVYSIKFVYSNGKSAYINDAIQLGVQ